jgi:hypothetical protein
MSFPIIIENFLSETELSFLLNYSQNSQELYNSHKSSCEFWNKRCIYFHSIPDSQVQDLLFEKSIEMRNIIQNRSIISTNLYVEYPQFVKWEAGWELPPHCDNCEPDGITPNATPWRSHGGVIYLNDDFEDGEIFYPKLDLEIRPKPGMMVIHPAGVDYLHGIKKITEGTRHTISVFFTYQSTSSNLISEEAEKSLTDFYINT